MLIALIVCLSKRMHMSRRRIQEFLKDWLGLHLSIGTINQCIHEAGRAVAPVEEQLIEDIRNSGLVYADETGWKEKGDLFWMWVFLTSATVLILVGHRRSNAYWGRRFAGG
ncbi:MAG: transposase [Gammaproteobacteria bacterium]|nr:transposase [Gammaproteobacteria bacterium]